MKRRAIQESSVAETLYKIKRALTGRPVTRQTSAQMARKERYAGYAIGPYTYGDPEILAWSAESMLSIGAFCSIADGVVMILDGEHRTDWVTTFPMGGFFSEAKDCRGHPRSKGEVRIGNDVWIGRDALILSGVTIGDGAVIGARSVVAKHVSPYAIVGGNPARLIRYRFDEAEIAALQRIAWWNWPREKIAEAMPLLLSSDIKGFIRKYG